MRIKPFGIDLYVPPKVERAYLLKPQLGKQDKVPKKNFTEFEADLHREVPGPIYSVMTDLNKQFPFNRGRFLKAPRV